MGVPETDAKHSDWDQIGESYTAIRGIGYVLWYPASTESANLSEGNSVFEAVGRWQRREQASEMRINLCVGSLGAQLALMNDSGEGGKPSTDQDADLACQEHRFEPLGQTVPAI